MNRELPSFQEGEDHVKISHFTKKGMDITGVMHVGTNDWYEYPYYKMMGIENVIGFEPLGEAVRRFREKYPEAKDDIYQIGILNYDGIAPLFVASGDGQSSSMLRLHPDYLKQFPDQAPIDKEMVNVRKFTTWLEGHPEVDMGLFNCLVVDVEGKELEAIRSFGEHLKGFQMLNIELSGEPTYYYGPMAKTVVRYLKGMGFDQDSPIEPHNDVMFIRRDVK